MSFIRMDGPQAHDHLAEGSRQQGEVRLGEFLSPPEQAHGGKESGKKRTPEFRPRDRMRHGGDNGKRRGLAAASGPRYLLPFYGSESCHVTVQVSTGMRPYFFLSFRSSLS
jgi:hypothetical protein